MTAVRHFVARLKWLRLFRQSGPCAKVAIDPMQIPRRKLGRDRALRRALRRARPRAKQDWTRLRKRLTYRKYD